MTLKKKKKAAEKSLHIKNSFLALLMCISAIFGLKPIIFSFFLLTKKKYYQRRSAKMNPTYF